MATLGIAYYSPPTNISRGISQKQALLETDCEVSLFISQFLKQNCKYRYRQAECGRLAGAVESTWPEHVAKIYRKWNQDRDLELQR
jgi:hypothetical protein